MSNPFDRWPTLTRAIEPLPGGLASLRTRIAADDAALARTIDPLPGGLDALRDRIAADTATWQVASREVAPLPGGLVALRRTIRGKARRARLLPLAALAGTLAVALAIGIVTRSAPAHADRSAMKQLLGGPRPHPGAVALGIVDAVRPLSADDPRVADTVVVFRWVQPRNVP